LFHGVLVDPTGVEQQLKHFRPPRFEQQVGTPARQTQKRTVGAKRTIGGQHMQMRVPMQEFSVSLDGRDHAGDDVVAPQQTPDFRLE